MIHRTFALGALLVKGDAFEFRPARELVFQQAPDDEASLGIVYNRDEGGKGREDGLVRLVVEIGTSRHVAEIKLRDFPFLPDAERGFLSVRERLPPGEHSGAFVVEATMRTSGWLGGTKSADAEFRAEGKFTVRVR